MQTSPEIEKISEALFQLQGKLKPVQRSKVVKNKSYEFRYAPLDSIMETVTPLMQQSGLMVTQAVNADTLTTRLIHTSGQWLQADTFLNREHANMQGFGGEITYKRRYALCALLGIVSDEDMDVPKITGRGACEDALAALPQRRQNFLMDLAEIIKEKHKDGNDWGAFEEYSALTDQEERTGIWALLPSDVRSSIKKLSQQQRQGVTA
jgi:hypothetical protein